MHSRSIPAIHAFHLIEVLRPWGVTSTQLLDGTGLTAAVLARPDARLDLKLVETLVCRARRLTGEPGLGVHIGLHMGIVSHGFLGLAAMVAPTLGDALSLAARYAPTRTQALSLRTELGPQRSALVVGEHADFGGARDVVVVALLVGLVHLARGLTGRQAVLQIEVGFAAPSYFERFAAFLPPTSFGHAAHRIWYPSDVLRAPLGTADPAMLALSVSLCERELCLVQRSSSMRARVAHVALSTAGVLTTDQAAKAVGTSTRTLKRRLASEGTSYRQLVEELRSARATVLLRDPGLSMDEIATRLGYSHTANFIRAFRRWTEQTPGEWRARTEGETNR